LITLRPYQEKLVSETGDHFRAGYKSALICLPTGGGKTLTAGSIIYRTQQKGKTCWFLCNRIELIDQTIKAFASLGITAGIIAAGYPPSYMRPIQICSIDTLRTRLNKIPCTPDLIVWDECRSIHAAGWQKIYKHYPNAYHIGLDATPERADGKPLNEFFSKIITGPTVRELIAMGSLVPPRVYAPTAPDLSEVTTRFGDYDVEELSNAMNKPSITGSAIEWYQKVGENRSGIVFCVNIKHSEQVAAQFKASGINAWHVDGNTDKQVREWIIRKYRAGEIKILCNVGLFCAGFDVPEVGYIASLRPTQSISLFLQQCGRGSRPSPGKTDYILCDHAGNIYRHNMMPHDDREWSLEGRKKNKKKSTGSEPVVQVKQCPKCFLVHTPMDSCPECGHIYESDRKIEQREGELAEIDPETFKRQRKKEVKEAQTLEELQQIGRERGYKPGWAKIQWEIKNGARGNKYQQRNYAQDFSARRASF
jgi:DNA repair protein RadD